MYRQNLFSLPLTLVICCLVILFAVKLFGLQTVRAQQSTSETKQTQSNQETTSTAQKWEYALICEPKVSTEKAEGEDGTGVFTIGTVRICYLKEDPQNSCEDVNARAKISREQGETIVRNAAISNAFLRLGNNGWEMVGQAFGFADETNKHATCIYFKRPKQ